MELMQTMKKMRMKNNNFGRESSLLFFFICFFKKMNLKLFCFFRPLPFKIYKIFKKTDTKYRSMNFLKFRTVDKNLKV